MTDEQNTSGVPTWVVRTQETLGGLIRYPKLAEKLLLKPPVKFVHDIVTSFLKVSGFPEGLYSASELDSANLKDRDSKLHFIQKLIDVVAAATGKEVSCRASKVISGSEPEKTNEMLQLLAECHALPREVHMAAVAQVLQKETGGAVAAARTGGQQQQPPERATREPTQGGPEHNNNSSGGSSTAAGRHVPATTAYEAPSSTPSVVVTESSSSSSRPGSVNTAASSTRKPISSTPKVVNAESSERERAPGAGAGAATPDHASSGKRPTGGSALAEGGKGGHGDHHASLEDDPAGGGAAKESAIDRAYRILTRKGSSVASMAGVRSEQHGSARDTDAHSSTMDGGGAPQGYFAREALEERKELGDSMYSEGGKGNNAGAEAGAARKRKEGIILRTTDGSKTRQSQRNSEGTARTQADVHELQQQLQVLSKATHPIGIVVENNTADVEAILRELTQWRSEVRLQTQRLLECRREHQELLRPYEIQINELRAATAEQEAMVQSMRATVCANEKAIEQLILMMTGTD